MKITFGEVMMRIGLALALPFLFIGMYVVAIGYIIGCIIVLTILSFGSFRSLVRDEIKLVFSYMCGTAWFLWNFPAIMTGKKIFFVPVPTL
jgi:hypothetical protein